MTKQNKKEIERLEKEIANYREGMAIYMKHAKAGTITVKQYNKEIKIANKHINDLENKVIRIMFNR